MNEQPMIIDAVEDSGPARAHPTTRQLIILTAAFWGAEFLLASLRSVVDHSPKFELYTGLRLLTSFLGALECYLIHRLARRSRTMPFAPRATRLFLAAAAAGVINLKVGDFIQNFSSFHVSDYGAGWRIYNTVYWVMIFLVWTAIYLAMCYSIEASGHERRARMHEQLAHDAQLRALRFQLDPHFLFNTLNSVSALVLAGRNEAAETMIRRLSGFFRATLAANPLADITLQEEIDLQRTYLEIERVRFSDLSIDIELAGKVRSALVPTLLLQPLVENAVKYAVAHRSGPARIEVHAKPVAGGRVRIIVRDDGDCGEALPAAGTGTGLRNVRERIRTRFGSAGIVTAGPADGGGWQSEIEIPIVFPPFAASPRD